MPPRVAKFIRTAYPVLATLRRYSTRTGPVGAGNYKEPNDVDLVRYWQSHCAPYLRARFSPDDERGASLVEYALLVALIAIVCIAAVSLIGSNANEKFKSVASSLA